MAERSTNAVARKRKRDVMEESDSESTEKSTEEASGTNSEDSEVEDEEADAEQRRASQWVDEDDLDMYEQERNEKRDFKKDLESLSFGALLKAKRTIAKQEEEEASSNSSGSSDSESSGEEHPVMDKSEDRREKKEKVKRANKHAPMEMSSKRPVSRKRVVVDVASVKLRDPRFGAAVGDFSVDHFQKDYAFLSQVRETELGTLKESLSRARRLLASSPAHLREERRLEVEKLERAMKRSESTIERGRREALERDVLSRVKRDERSKRAQGKGSWYLKKSDERKIKIQARFESLSGKEAKKVMEKKQKKIAQREKKSRPFAPGQTGSTRRSSTEAGDGPYHRKKKRRD